MNRTKRQGILNILAAVFLLAACAPQETSTPEADSIGTLAAELASIMLTQTAMANPPPPPPPTETPPPPETETPTPEPEPAATEMPEVTSDNAPCYTGPGSNYPLVSHITATKKVELIGVGGVPGWYVIENPYFYSACWISADHLKIDSSFDLSAFPVIPPP